MADLYENGVQYLETKTKRKSARRPANICLRIVFYVALLGVLGISIYNTVQILSSTSKPIASSSDGQQLLQILNYNRQQLLSRTDVCFVHTISNGKVLCLRNQTGNYEQSKTFCGSIGAMLQEVVSWLENVKPIKPIIWGICIGLDDIITEGEYVFLDGVAAENQALVWKKNEPNNEHGMEDCVHLVKYHKYTLNDVYCDHVFPALCRVINIPV